MTIYLLFGIGFALIMMTMSDKKDLNHDPRLIVLASFIMVLFYPAIIVAGVFLALKRTLAKINEKDEAKLKDLDKRL